MHTKTRGTGDNKSVEKTLEYELRACGRSADARVNGFIDAAFAYYKEKKKDEAPFLRTAENAFRTFEHTRTRPVHFIHVIFNTQPLAMY